MEIPAILVALVLGGIGGYVSPISDTRRVANVVVSGSLVLLLVAIGAQLGVDDGLLRNLDAVGGAALAICLGAVVGSVGCVVLGATVVSFGTAGKTVRSSSGSDPSAAQESRDGTASGTPWRTTLLVFAALFTGVGLGIGGLPAAAFALLTDLADVALLALLVGVGLAVGANRGALGYVSATGWRVLLLPVAVAVGSIVGGVAVGFAIDLPLSQTSAVAAGFGWYSYAGVIVFDLGYPQLAATAFLANFLREVLTFLVLPPTFRYLGGAASIAPGGATTMDVTLPMIQRVSGDAFVVPALVNGLVLSAAATVLVPLLLSL